MKALASEIVYCNVHCKFLYTTILCQQTINIYRAPVFLIHVCLLLNYL